MAGFEHKKHWRDIALCKLTAISASRIRAVAKGDPHLKCWQPDSSLILVCIALQFQQPETSLISCLHCSAVPLNYQPGSACSVGNWLHHSFLSCIALQFQLTVNLVALVVQPESSLILVCIALQLQSMIHLVALVVLATRIIPHS